MWAQPLIPKLTSAYKKDLRLAEARGWDIDNSLLPPLTLLLSRQPLPPRYQDHPLRGEWSGYREFHVAPDWLVIYRIVDEFLVLARTGSHADLFKK